MPYKPKWLNYFTNFFLLDKKQYKRLCYLTIFGIVFGYLESSVVVYLRELYYPNGFKLAINIGFPYLYFGTCQYLESIPLKIYLVEIFREASTIIMLASIGILSGNNTKERFAYFIWTFAIWDIFYYVFLKIILGWPASLGTIDVLFLIPVPWLAPVWLPLLATFFMIIISFYFLNKSSIFYCSPK